MSVLIVNRKVFGKVAARLASLTYCKVNELNTPLCVNYYLSRRNIASNDRIYQFIGRLAYYNEISLSARHGEKKFDAPSEDFMDGVENMCEHCYCEYEDKEMSVYQLVKYLGCMYYNIDLDGWGAEFVNEADQRLYKDDIETLSNIIRSINSHIVSQSDEYRNAKWSEE